MKHQENRPHRSLDRLPWGLVASLALAPAVAAQGAPELTFSVDFSGPLMGQPGNAQGTPISDGDLLVRRGLLFGPATPEILLPVDFLATYASCAGHAPGVLCGLELNALSFGRDAQLRLDPGYAFNVLFSVDEFAVGRQGSTVEGTSVFTEAQGAEAAGDLFLAPFTGGPPFLPQVPRGYADGDGRQIQPGSPFVFGLGLTEPIPRTGSTVDLGDNVDALDYGERFNGALDQVYFSLEGGFPRCDEPNGASLDSAGLQPIAGGFASSSDVLLYDPLSGSIVPYVGGPELGLDLMGVGTDDIDALMVFENGITGYQPPIAPYDWAGPQGSDLVLFSVRCGSSIIGTIDPVSQRAIGEGDILLKLAGAAGPPRVFISATSLGLRSLAGGSQRNDELNAFDIFDEDDDPFLDCNMNGIDDGVDISYMNSDDVDLNGIPDECEDDWQVICDCDDISEATCGNTAATGAGCMNVAGTGGRLNGAGTTSMGSDALQLVVTDLVPNTFGVAFTGQGFSPGPVGNGRRCVVSGTQPVTRIAISQADATGAFNIGPGILSSYAALPSMPIVALGTTWGFQVYYRDVGGPCGAPANMTNALTVTFTP